MTLVCHILTAFAVMYALCIAHSQKILETRAMNIASKVNNKTSGTTNSSYSNVRFDD